MKKKLVELHKNLELAEAALAKLVEAAGPELAELEAAHVKLEEAAEAAREAWVRASEAVTIARCDAERRLFPDRAAFKQALAAFIRPSLPHADIDYLAEEYIHNRVRADAAVLEAKVLRTHATSVSEATRDEVYDHRKSGTRYDKVVAPVVRARNKVRWAASSIAEFEKAEVEAQERKHAKQYKEYVDLHTSKAHTLIKDFEWPPMDRPLVEESAEAEGEAEAC